MARRKVQPPEGGTPPVEQAKPANPTTTTPPLVEIGVTGLNRQAGHVYENVLRDLDPTKRIKVFREMSRTASPIVSMLFAIEMLIRQAASKTRIEPGGDTPADEEAAEFLDECREDMSVTWSDFIAAAVWNTLVYGFAPFELVYKQRVGPDEKDSTKRSKFTDGKIGWRKIAERSPETLHQWVFDDTGGVKEMVQVAPPDYIERHLPIEKLILFRTSTVKGNPEGRSVLEGAYTSWFMYRHIQRIEAIGIERDLAGLPVMEVPPAYLASDATADMKTALELFKDAVRNVRRDEQEGLILPLAYDENGNELFRFKLLSTGGDRQFDINPVVERYARSMLMTVLADFIVLGHEKVGSFALSSDKTNLFGVALDAWIEMIEETLNRYPVPRLLKFNAFEVEKPPRIVLGRVEQTDLKELSTYIATLAGAGMPLFPDEELETFLREKANLPDLPPPEERAAMLAPPMLPGMEPPPGEGAPPGQQPPPPGGKQPSPGDAGGGKPAAKKPEVEKTGHYDDQPRDDRGRWSDGGGSGGSDSGDGEAVRTSDVNEAAKALGEGRRVILNQPREVSTLLAKLRSMVDDAKAKGEKAPTYDLCKVSVAGTNVFCAESKGIPRVKMPQLSGRPLPGSKGDALPKDAKGEINLGEKFREYLFDKGAVIRDVTERASYLRASQSELNGAKVAGMVGALEAGKMKSAAIFVSAENYVIDGHHRWAANLGLDAADNRLGDVRMPVARIEMPILFVLDEANKFAADWGILQAGVDKRARGGYCCGCGHRVEKYDPDQPRDEQGRWSNAGGGGGSDVSAEGSGVSDFADAGVASVAVSYAKQAGLPPVRSFPRVALTPEEGRAIADAYDRAVSTPDDPATREAYGAFRSEVTAQYEALKSAGYQMIPWDQPGQPYANSAAMRDDVLKNKRLFYFRTEGTESTAPNLLMPPNINDQFRAVHDIFGHALAGNQFGPKGEVNATLDHSLMFSPKATRAMMTETIGQNAWFNFSLANEGKPVTERAFADQKAFLLDEKLYAPLLRRRG